MSRKYKYAKGDDEESDAFINNVVSNAPKRKVEETPHSDHEMQDLHNARTYYSGSNSLFGEERYTNNCSRIFVFIFSGLLFVAGLGIIIFAAVEKHAKVLPVCPKCDHFVVAMYVFGGCLMLLAVWGLAAARTRIKCLAYPFSVFVILVSLAFVACGIAAAVFALSMKDMELEKLWKDAVKDDTSFVCRFQNDFQCSGFGAGQCCKSYDDSVDLSSAFDSEPSAATSALLDTNTGSGQLLDATAAPANPTYCYVNATDTPWVAQVCVPTCKSNAKYTQTCDQSLRKEIKKHFVPIIVTLFFVALLLGITAAASIRMTWMAYQHK